MINHLKWVFCSLVVCFFTDLYSEIVSIKTYHTLTSFGTETKRLRNSVVMQYDQNKFLEDSSIYNHDIPLSEKYVYIVGIDEGLKLKRDFIEGIKSS